LKQTQTRIAILAITILGIALATLAVLLIEEDQVVELAAPITHQPTYLGNPSFLLGSGNVMQNGTAYSYVRINATAIVAGDTFVVFPALDVGLKGASVNENNLTAKVTYTGLGFGTSPYWINFSVSLSQLSTRANLSRSGISSNFSRSSFALTHFSGAELFLQLSSVVGETNEFELFFYIGNVSTPVPQLAQGPPH
jgi:hypothetical protein